MCSLYTCALSTACQGKASENPSHNSLHAAYYDGLGGLRNKSLPDQEAPTPVTAHDLCCLRHLAHPSSRAKPEGLETWQLPEIKGRDQGVKQGTTGTRQDSFGLRVGPEVNSHCSNCICSDPPNIPGLIQLDRSAHDRNGPA